MRNVLTTLALTLSLTVAGATPARAAGPFCFQLTPFPNIVAWFVDGTGGNQFVGSGRDLSQNAAQIVTGFVTGNTFVANFVTAAGPTSLAYMASAEISLVSLSGPGRFQNIWSEGVVSASQPVTVASTICPPAALALAEPKGPGFAGGAPAVGASPFEGLVARGPNAVDRPAR